MQWKERYRKKKLNKRDSIEEKLAKIRGIEDIDRFLHPQEDELLDPYLLKNIELASNRIILAIAQKQRIVISMDCDTDGITAGVTMYRYLKNYTDEVDYIYGERNDGHGITEQIETNLNLDYEENIKRLENSKNNINKIKECDLLIIVDSSSNDTKTCEKIKSLGKDIIILDHHEIERENPHVIMVNPQQRGCEYPNKFISGAGVVFKTVQVMEDTLGQVDPFNYIDLVAVGMYADMMNMSVLENRYIVMCGLRNMKNVGLVRILKGGKVDLFKVDCSAIGFTIAPLINAVSRMENIKLAIDILLTDDDNVAKKLRLQMSKMNDLRKERQKEIVEQYSKNIDSTKKALIVLDEQSSKGFNGLVAQQLTEKFRRPAIVGRLHNGVLSGSFRSYNGFKFKTFLQGFDGEIEALGHEYAGGIVIPEKELDNLQKYIQLHLPELEEKEQYVTYDIEIDAKEIDEYIKVIERFNLVYGNGYPKIIVRVSGISVMDVETLGATRETRKIKTFDGLELIKFRVNENYASELECFDDIDAVGELCMNEFYNFKTKKKTCTPQIKVDDYKLR